MIKYPTDTKGIDVSIRNKPYYEPDFIPAYKFVKGYLQGASEPYAFAWQRSDGSITKFDTFVYGTKECEELDLYYLKLMTEMTFLSWGGWKLYLCGNQELSQKLKAAYLEEQEIQSVLNFLLGAAGKKAEFEILPYEQCPEKEISKPIGRHLNGCRIGFDAGSSDRKVSAVIDGEVVYSEEVVWYAKFRSDIDYHYNEILTAFKTAASKMPRVDAIGVSTAGLIVNNQQYAASFYKMVPPEDVVAKGRDIYQRAAREIGENIPLVVINDGDISALAGSMTLGKNKLWGVAIGTSIGTGYVDGLGNLSSRMCEFSNARIALNASAALNESKARRGVGESYFSQDAVNRLALGAGIPLAEDLYPAEKLLIVQEHMKEDDPRVRRIFEHIGCCFAHSLPFVKMFFDIENVCLLGRVVSAKGGDLMLETINRVLKEEYPEISESVTIWLPDEQQRRVSQSVAAASLAEIKD